jgi:hypothetical protein
VSSSRPISTYYSSATILASDSAVYSAYYWSVLFFCFVQFPDFVTSGIQITHSQFLGFFWRMDPFTFWHKWMIRATPWKRPSIGRPIGRRCC